MKKYLLALLCIGVALFTACKNQNPPANDGERCYKRTTWDNESMHEHVVYEWITEEQKEKEIVTLEHDGYTVLFEETNDGDEYSCQAHNPSSNDGEKCYKITTWDNVSLHKHVKYRWYTDEAAYDDKRILEHDGYTVLLEVTGDGDKDSCLAHNNDPENAD